MDTIGIIGLGYIGLPLAVAFGKKIKTIGFLGSKILLRWGDFLYSAPKR